MQKFLVSNIDRVHVNDSGSFVGVNLRTPEDEMIALGLHPNAAKTLVTALLRELEAASSDGRLAQPELPIPETIIQGVASPADIHLSFDRPDMGLRTAVSVTLAQTRQLKEMLGNLLEEAELMSGQLN
jgi:hypothetical protein